MKKIAPILAVLLASALSVAAQQTPKPPKSPRIYIFNCGVIKGLSPASFNFKPEEVKATDFFVSCFLIVHPKGTLMWDVGVVPDSAFKGDGSPVVQGISTVQKPLIPQLAEIGYKPSDITYFALSHYHSDHTANANAFAGSTWVTRKAERDYMFSEKPAGIIQTASFSALKDSKTKILGEEDFDVFGDGKVVMKSAPGHTPGHQVLYVKLKKTGPVLIAGDLYHYPEERNSGKVPTFEFNKEQSLKSRAAIEEFLKKTHAQLWIEHDTATVGHLKHAPEFYE